MATLKGWKDVGTGIAYDYGIDKNGKMYIWDKWSNKMVYYGDPKKGYSDWIFDLSVGHDAKLNYQGDKTNGKWASVGNQANATEVPSNTSVSTYGASGGYSAPAKTLDQDQIDALKDQFGVFDDTYNTSKKKAAVKRDTSLEEKNTEHTRENTKYKGKKLTTLQDFSGAKTDTDINTRNTLENLISSLSTMGLGGSRALTRKVLDAANVSNRKANATQATNNQSLDTAWNDYETGYEGDVNKIKDQYDYDAAEAERALAQAKQNNYYKIADVYNDAGLTDERKQYMEKANSLNKVIGNAAFVNPRYTGKVREIATPELADYQQNIATYDTSSVGAPMAEGGVTPVGAEGAPVPGNLAVRAIALNNKDLGVKKKTEAELGYGV